MAKALKSFSTQPDRFMTSMIGETSFDKNGRYTGCIEVFYNTDTNTPTQIKMHSISLIFDGATPWKGHYEVYPRRASFSDLSDHERKECIKQRQIVEVVHAYVFSTLWNKSGQSNIETFNLTLPSDPKIHQKMKLLGLKDVNFPYSRDQESTSLSFYKLPYLLNDILLARGVENQITINDENPKELLGIE